MKMSEYIKQYDIKNPNDKIRTISIEYLLNITDFDNQPERSKREDGLYVKYIPCKHTITYYSFEKKEKSIDLIPLEENLTDYIKNLCKGKELSYWDLSKEQKEDIDNEWDNYDPMRCSEHCGNIVRDK